MCNNNVRIKSRDERSMHFLRMGQYAAEFLKGQSVEQIAEMDGVPVEEVEGMLEEIRDINPYLYKQVVAKKNQK